MKSPLQTSKPQKKWGKTLLQTLVNGVAHLKTPLRWITKNPLTVLPIVLALSCLAVLPKPPDATRNEKEYLKTTLIQTPTSFCPTEADRLFWTSLPPIVPNYSVPTKSPQQLPPTALAWKLYEGTPRTAVNPNTQWISYLTNTLNHLCEVPWREVRIPEKKETDTSNPPRAPREAIDLNTTLIAANMAATVRILSQSIPPATIKKVTDTINSRIIDSYLKESARFQAEGKSWGITQTFWIGAPDNWTAVCLANIAYASLAINNKEKNSVVLEAILRDLPAYLESFDDDGYFPGGIRYWEYGFGHFVLLNEILSHATQGKINFYTLPKVREAIHFPARTTIGIGPPQGVDTLVHHIRFGDNHGNARVNRWIWDILNKRYENPYAIPEVKYPENGYPSLPIADLLLNPPKMRKIPEMQLPQKDTLFPTAGVLIARPTTEGLALASKGNHNAEENNHNQNDVGSYTVYQNGQYLTGDVGGGKYEGAFGPRRFTRDLESSWGHPVPVVDGQLQANGREFFAKVLENQTGKNTTRIKYELSNAYQVPGLQSLIREISLNKETQTVLVRDSFAADRPIAFESPLIQGITLTKPIRPAVQVKTSGKYQIKENYLPKTDQFESVHRVSVELEKNTTGWIEFTLKAKPTPTPNKQTSSKKQ